MFWICVFLLSLYICSDLMTNVWHKWNNNPVIHIFAEKTTPVYQIPFPTMTICMESKALPKIFHYSDVVDKIRFNTHNVTQEEHFYMEAIAQTCVNDVLTFHKYGKSFANASDLSKALKQAGPYLESVCDECEWRTDESCCNSFHPILTEEGICYSLNDFSPSDIYRDEVPSMNLVHDDYNNYQKVEWDLENGYNLNAKEDTFPYRVFTSGNKAGVQITFEVDIQEKKRKDLMCRMGAEGFKIVFTTPGEVPRVSKQFIPIPLGQTFIISIKPEIITTSEALRHYAPTSRNCYFQDERYLRFFKLYTQSNCKLECLSNFTLKHCECVKFSMPRSVDTAVCGAGKINCMNEAADLLPRKEFRSSLKTAEKKFNDEDRCNCLPTCTSIIYNAEVSQAKVDANWYKKKYQGFRVSTFRESRLSIFFKEAEFLTTKRAELFSTTDFLANCGGLLGLLMGMSTLSIVELVYFCTVRMITNLKMRRRKRLQRLQNEETIATGLNKKV